MRSGRLGDRVDDQHVLRVPAHRLQGQRGVGGFEPSEGRGIRSGERLAVRSEHDTGAPREVVVRDRDDDVGLQLGKHARVEVL